MFDGELDATDVFVSLISQKYGKTNTKEYLAKAQRRLAKLSASGAVDAETYAVMEDAAAEIIA